MNALVKTRHGEVRGSAADGINTFKGIPFAAPQFDANRLRPPQPVEPWSGVRDALTYGAKPPEEDSVDVAGILEPTGARDHRVFSGKLDRSTLGFAEKAIMLAVRAAEGDFRDWEAIRERAREIATELHQEASSGRSGSDG